MARVEIGQSKLEEPDIYLVQPKGKLDVFAFGDLKSFFEQLCQANRSAKIVADLSQADYIASSGWSVFLSRRRVLRLSGGEMVLCGMKPEIKRVYDSMKVFKLLPSAESVDAAKELAKQGSPG